MDTPQSSKGIHFDPVKHVYTNDKGEKYISGTKFISLFKQPFDKEFWQKYKAVQRILEDKGQEDLWKKVKMKYLRTEDKKLFYEAAFNEVSVAKVNKMIKEIDQEWKNKTTTALTKGTAYHDGQEAQIRKEHNHTHDWNWLDISYPNLKPDIYPELRLYNHKHKLAGSADKTKIFKNGEVMIVDYKTSKTIEFESWTNPWTGNENKMLYVCSGLDDANFNHYTLQLSLYGWMMEQLGYKVRRLTIEHILFDENGKFMKKIPYNCEYMRNTIEAMIDYYETNLK